jgi:hypothetical protein
MAEESQVQEAEELINKSEFDQLKGEYDNLAKVNQLLSVILGIHASMSGAYAALVSQKSLKEPVPDIKLDSKFKEYYEANIQNTFEEFLGRTFSAIVEINGRTSTPDMAKHFLRYKKIIDKIEKALDSESENLPEEQHAACGCDHPEA